MFDGLSEKLNNAFKSLRSKGKLTPDDVKVGMREIKMALLEADVNYKVVRDFIKTVSERAVGAEDFRQKFLIATERCIYIHRREQARIERKT